MITYKSANDGSDYKGAYKVKDQHIFTPFPISAKHHDLVFLVYQTQLHTRTAIPQTQ
jgi:hypothetical protein